MYINVIIPFVLIQISSLIIIVLLCRNGTSMELKIRVAKRHFVYLVCYDLYMFSPIYREGNHWISIVILQLIGVFLACIRFFEPFVFTRFINSNCKRCKMSRKFSEQPMCSFANSSLNIEYVYLILVGIS